MTATDGYLLAATHARDAAYDVVLLAHVLAAAVGLGAVVVAGRQCLGPPPIGSGPRAHPSLLPSRGELGRAGPVPGAGPGRGR